ncbi:MAG TPA: zf-HC2 domain-containing protein [Acidimicrobiia bacterium]|nr:zf-HC2 domain-containing protein [Acidimicrobiia bacterium]
MHEHDADLVAALAEGALSPEDTRAAEAAISGCPRCTADHTAQRTAVVAMRSLAGARLGDTERTGLRAAVADAINLDLEAAPKTPTRRRARRAVPWPSVAVAALSVLAVVAIVPLVGTLTTSGSDDEAATAELALTTIVTDTAAAAAAEAAPIEGGEESTAQRGDDGALSADAAASPSTLAVSAVPEAGESTLERVADTDLRALLEDPTALLAIAEPPPGPCDAVADTFFTGLDGVLVGQLPEFGAVGYFTTGDGSSVDRIVVVDPDTCEILSSLG